MSSRAERSEGEWKDVDHLAIAVDPLSLQMGKLRFCLLCGTDRLRPDNDRDGRHEISAAAISASGSGCCRAPRCFALRLGASLSDAACALIVGFPPGGPTDIVARLMGQW